MNFKPGDRVICAHPHPMPDRFFNPQYKGQNVIVTGVANCPACGSQKVATGLIASRGCRATCSCGCVYQEAQTGGEIYLLSSRYVKAVEKTEYIAVAVDVNIEEPALN